MMALRGVRSSWLIIARKSDLAWFAASASALYAKNLYAFLDILIDKNTKALAVNWDDELVKATALTKDGAVIHPNFQPKTV